MWENRQLSCRSITNNYWRYSSQQKVAHNSPLLQCGLCTVTSIQRPPCGKNTKNNLPAEEPDKHCPSQVAKADMTVLF